MAQSQKLFRQGYVTELEVEGNAFTVTQAELELRVKETQLRVLEEYTKQMEMETLQGNLTASKSKLAVARWAVATPPSTVRAARAKAAGAAVRVICMSWSPLGGPLSVAPESRPRVAAIADPAH